jgi:hypothetical protein
MVHCKANIVKAKRVKSDVVSVLLMFFFVFLCFLVYFLRLVSLVVHHGVGTMVDAGVSMSVSAEEYVSHLCCQHALVQIVGCCRHWLQIYVSVTSVVDKPHIAIMGVV